ncbi:sulfotransferase family protein [Winogradskyella sp. HB-48]|uniref:sulfotransferase family protein n=1 Tax=Winogradskyella sp. HB-48 TaxID=3416808 RepID=UPI003CF37BD8
MINKPDFLIVGAAKSGTTSLCHSLGQHRDIFISNPKEPKFFTYEFLKEYYLGPGDDFTKKKAVKSYEEYLRLFAKAKPNQIIGEGSVDNLFYYKWAIPIIKNLLGDPKIIIMLRSPSLRAFSAYSHLIRDGRETLSFKEGLNNETDRMNEGYEFIWAYKEASKYYDSVKAYKENFSNVKVIIFEKFIQNKKEGIKDVLNFLNQDTSILKNIKFEKQNISGKPKKKWINKILLKDSFLKTIVKSIFPETKRQNLKQWLLNKNLEPIGKDESQIHLLKSEFEDDISKLEKLLGIDLSIWK